MKQPHAGLQGNVLTILVIADPVQNELLGNHGRDVAAQVVLDDVEHQVQRGDPPRTREAVTVNRKQLVREDHPWELFLQGRHVFPVNDRLVFVQQASLGQRVATRTQGTQ